MDQQSVWMLLARHMFATCQAMNDRQGCASGLLFCALMKHSIVVTVEGSARILSIGKEHDGDTSHRTAFRVRIEDEGNAVSMTVATVDGEQFHITGTTKQFSVEGICQDVLDLLCRHDASHVAASVLPRR